MRTAILCENYFLFYIYIPKNACTTLKHAFYELIKNTPYPSDVVKPIANKEIEKYPNYFKYVFIRNPYHRFISFYTNKIKVLQKPPYGNFLRKFGFHETMTTKETIELVLSIGDSQDLDPHFAPQHYFFNPKDMNYIGKIETIYQDWENIKNLANLPDIKLNHLNTSNPNQSLLTPEIKELIYERYRKDFEIGGYEK